MATRAIPKLVFELDVFDVELDGFGTIVFVFLYVVTDAECFAMHDVIYKLALVKRDS